MSNYHINMRLKCRALRNEALISLVEVAKKLDYCPNIIRHFINKHQIRAYKIGGKWYLSKEQVDTLEKYLQFKKKNR